MASSVVVVGAGMSGLTAAGRLAGAGHRVVVVDKGRGVGGRMATRRFGGAVADHGAQFFTARSEWFVARVGSWADAGVAREWCRGFRAPFDGHPRYVGATGMTAVAKHLAAGLDVRTGTTVASVSASPSGVAVHLADAAPLDADAVLLTSPVPQSLALMAAGGTTVDASALEALQAVGYSPTLAAMVVTDGPTAVPSPGGVQSSDGPISWVGDNVAKGISPLPSVTLHASPSTSASLYDEPAEEVLATIIAAGSEWLGGARVVDSQLARWRYAQPTTSHDARHLVAVDGPAPVVCAGDAFGEAKVEGAAQSGWSAAGELIDRLG